MPAAPVSAAHLAPASFSELPNWAADDHAAALGAFRKGCASLEHQEIWRAACASARDPEAGRDARAFFESRFRAYRLINEERTDTGLITGYYEPLLHGSRVRGGPYLYPVYAPPDDLVHLDPGTPSADAQGLRLRGRMNGQRIVPYYTRAEIEAGHAPPADKVLFWVDDRIALFFMHVQGSGRIRLTDGSTVRLGYADQNGHPYRSIGRVLVDRGELPAEQASMATIRAWTLMHPDQVDGLLASNPSYVFFKVLPGDDPSAGPPGTLGVGLIAGRSVAVDRRFIPLGAPLYLSTTQPNSPLPLERTVIALDTGSAIRGPVRADYYWGFGDGAGQQAGRMRQPGRLWLMLPQGYPGAPH